MLASSIASADPNVKDQAVNNQAVKDQAVNNHKVNIPNYACRIPYFPQ